jgi:hypothetical protein
VLDSVRPSTSGCWIVYGRVPQGAGWCTAEYLRVLHGFEHERMQCKTTMRCVELKGRLMGEWNPCVTTLLHHSWCTVRWAQGLVLRRALQHCTSRTNYSKNAVFWDVMPCDSCNNRHFEGMCQLHIQGDNNQRARNVPLQRVSVTSYC